MRTFVLSVLVSISAFALAQDLAGLPTCAQTAALNGAAGSGCSLSDAECFCKNTGFIDSLRAAISTSCTDAAEQQAACDWGNSACATYGVSIPCANAAPTPPVDSNDAVTTTPPAAVDPASPPANDAGSSVDAGPTDAAGSMTTTTPTDTRMAGGLTSDTSIPSMTTVPSSSVPSMMNGTHTSGNATHSATNKPSTTSAGPTSQYTGAGNAAVRHSGVFGTVFGVALLFAFF